MTREINLIVSINTIGTLRRAGVFGTITTTPVSGYCRVTTTTAYFPLICRIAKTVTSGIIWKIPAIGTNVKTVTDNVTGPTVTTAPHWISGLIDAVATIDADGKVLAYDTTGPISSI